MIYSIIFLLSVLGFIGLIFYLSYSQGKKFERLKSSLDAYDKKAKVEKEAEKKWNELDKQLYNRRAAIASWMRENVTNRKRADKSVSRISRPVIKRSGEK